MEHDGRLGSALEEFRVAPEAVEVIAYGEAGSAVIGTATRVLVYKRGIRAGVPFGRRLKVFEYESVMSVNLRRVDRGGVLAVHAPLKIGSCAVYWIDERDDAWKARNALVLSGDVAAYEPVVEHLRDLAAAHQASHGRATPDPFRLTAAGPAVPPEAQPVCSSCSTLLEPAWRYCPECGTSFDRPAEQWSWLRSEQRSTPS